jgi:hypothetical protein
MIERHCHTRKDDLMPSMKPIYVVRYDHETFGLQHMRDVSTAARPLRIENVCPGAWPNTFLLHEKMPDQAAMDLQKKAIEAYAVWLYYRVLSISDFNLSEVTEAPRRITEQQSRDLSSHLRASSRRIGSRSRLRTYRMY